MGHHTWKLCLHSMFTSFKMGQGEFSVHLVPRSPRLVKANSFSEPKYCRLSRWLDLLLSGNTVLSG